MDFDGDLTQIQGALMSANNTYDFQNFYLWNDKKAAIEKIVLVLHKILSEKKYLLENSYNANYSDNLKKITMFFMFNAELKSLDDLVNNNDVGHLIRITPIIPKPLLISIVLGLHLEEFYCDAIKYCHPNMSLELSTIATENIVDASPEKSIKIAKILIISVYVATLRLFNSQQFLYTDILDGYYRNIFELLKYYHDPPNKTQMASWKKMQRYLHSGKCLYTFYETLMSCFNFYINKKTEIIHTNDEIYSYTYNIKSTTENLNNQTVTQKKIKLLHSDIYVFVRKYHDLFYSYLEVLLKNVDVQVFCSWTEIELPNDPSKSLQQGIAEMSYHLFQLINDEDNNLFHDASAYLKSFMQKPVDINDIIMQSDITEVIKKAREKSSDQRLWLIGMLNSQFFFTNEHSMNCFCLNIDALSDNDCFEAFQRCIKEFYNQEKFEKYYASNLKSFKFVIFTCFSKFHIDYKKKALLSAFSKNALGNRIELPGFDVKCVEVLNKFVKINDDTVSEFLDLFIQNPFKLFMHIFDRCAKNSKAIKLLDALYIFSDMRSLNYDESYLEYQFIRNQGRIEIDYDLQVVFLVALKNIDVQYFENSVENKGLVVLIKELIDKNILPARLVIFRYLTDQIDKYLAERDLQKTLMFLKCTVQAFKVDKFQRYLALMIVRMAQIMELVRWSITTYSITAAEILDAVISFERLLISEFKKTYCLESDYHWVISKLNFLTPLNLVYFKELLPQHKLMPLLHDVRNYKELSVSLCFLLPRSRTQEWKLLYEQLTLTENPSDIFRIFVDSIMCIVPIAISANIDKSYACLENCCRNLAIVLQDCILPLNNHDNRNRLVKEIIYLINVMPPNVESNCFNAFLTPLSKITNMYVNSNSQEEIKNKFNIMTTTEKLQNLTFRKIVLRMFAK